MKSANTGEAHSLSHSNGNRSRTFACTSAKLIGVGSTKSERSTWVN
jgi:hypothetical protein